MMEKTAMLPVDIKIMNWVTAFVCTIGLAGAVLVFFQNSKLAFLKINEIVVLGDVSHSSASSIKFNVINKLKGNFFSINLPEIKSSFETLPWVKSVSVNRVFPNKVNVNVTEYRAFGVWGDADNLKMVDPQGALFSLDSDEGEDFDGLPQFIGPESEAVSMINMLRKLNSILDPLSLKIAKIKLDIQGSWMIILNNGASIDIGRGRELDIMNRVNSFANSLKIILSKYNKNIDSLQYVDLRHVNGYAIKIDGLTTQSQVLTPPVIKK